MLGKSKNTVPTVQTKIGTIIGEGAVFDGNLTAPEAIRVDGTINGNCTCEANLIIGTEGKIEGNISAQNVTISGKVNGDIFVQGKLEEAMSKYNRSGPPKEKGPEPSAGGQPT